jgi:hypothetical protein
VSASALALALAAAALHAGWNVLLARAGDVRAATTVALVIGVVLFAPAAVVTWDVEVEALPWIAASAALEIVYFALLTAAYGRSDLSLVYPIARGVAPFVLVGAAFAGRRSVTQPGVPSSAPASCSCGGCAARSTEAV